MIFLHFLCIPKMVDVAQLVPNLQCKFEDPRKTLKIENFRFSGLECNYFLI